MQNAEVIAERVEIELEMRESEVLMASLNARDFEEKERLRSEARFVMTLRNAVTSLVDEVEVQDDLIDRLRAALRNHHKAECSQIEDGGECTCLVRATHGAGCEAVQPKGVCTCPPIIEEEAALEVVS